MRFVSREEAICLIDQRLTEQGHCRCCHLRLCRPEKLRNYELEDRLEDLFGEDFCINEPCPFNGDYCKWSDFRHGSDHAPEH